MDENNVKIQAVQINADDTTTTPIFYDNCEQSKTFTLDSQHISGLGRFLNFSVTIKRVCPNKRVAVGLLLYETTGGCRIMKGHKAYAVSHNEHCCADIRLNNVKFVMPEELADTNDNESVCPRRSFEMEFVAHYVNFCSGSNDD